MKRELITVLIGLMILSSCGVRKQTSCPAYGLSKPKKTFLKY